MLNHVTSSFIVKNRLFHFVFSFLYLQYVEAIKCYQCENTLPGCSPHLGQVDEKYLKDCNRPFSYCQVKEKESLSLTTLDIVDQTISFSCGDWERRYCTSAGIHSGIIRSYCYNTCSTDGCNAFLVGANMTETDGRGPGSGSGTGVQKVLRDTSSGAIQIYRDNEWVYIYPAGADRKVGDVICSMLGYNEASEIRAAYPPEPGIRHWLRGVHCTGAELHIDECMHGGWGNYLHGIVLEVDCQQNNPYDVAVNTCGGFPCDTSVPYCCTDIDGRYKYCCEKPRERTTTTETETSWWHYLVGLAVTVIILILIIRVCMRHTNQRDRQATTSNPEQQADAAVNRANVVPSESPHSDATSYQGPTGRDDPPPYSSIPLHKNGQIDTIETINLPAYSSLQL